MVKIITSCTTYIVSGTAKAITDKIEKSKLFIEFKNVKTMVKKNPALDPVYEMEIELKQVFVRVESILSVEGI